MQPRITRITQIIFFSGNINLRADHNERWQYQQLRELALNKEEGKPVESIAIGSVKSSAKNNL